jgi:hypothetical protein
MAEVDSYSADYEQMMVQIYLDVEHDHHYFDLLLDNYVVEFLVEHSSFVVGILDY